MIVKSTSVVTASAQSLPDHSAGRACLLWVDLQTWLATALRDAGLRASILATEHSRCARIGLTHAAIAESEPLARIWLAEQLRWRMLAAGLDDAERLTDLDFSTVLRPPADAVSALAHHYGLAVPADLAQRIESSASCTARRRTSAMRSMRKRDMAKSAGRIVAITMASSAACPGSKTPCRQVYFLNSPHDCGLESLRVRIPCRLRPALL